MKSIDFRTNWISDFLPIGSLWLETSATALCGPYVNYTLLVNWFSYRWMLFLFAGMTRQPLQPSQRTSGHPDRTIAWNGGGDFWSSSWAGKTSHPCVHFHTFISMKLSKSVGLVRYSTCTLNKWENEGVCQKLLTSVADCERIPLKDVLGVSIDASGAAVGNTFLVFNGFQALKSKKSTRKSNYIIGNYR